MRRTRGMSGKAGDKRTIVIVATGAALVAIGVAVFVWWIDYAPPHDDHAGTRTDEARPARNATPLSAADPVASRDALPVRADATDHRAISGYARAQADRREATWEELKSSADAGDTVAACKLSTVLEGCRRAREVRAQIDEEIDTLALDSPAEREDAIAKRLADNESELSALNARCGGVPDDVVRQEWRYVVAAADAGHELSMYRFAMFPPIDESRPLDYADAIQAYKQRSKRYAGQLMNRGSAEGLLVAYALVSGMPMVGMSSGEPMDAKLMVEYGSALAILRNKPAILDSAVASAQEALGPAEIASARAAGQRLATTLSFRVLGNGGASVLPESSRSSCDSTWDQAR